MHNVSPKHDTHYVGPKLNLLSGKMEGLLHSGIKDNSTQAITNFHCFLPTEYIIVFELYSCVCTVGVFEN